MTIKVTVVKGEGLERWQETGQRKKSLGTFLSSKTEERGEGCIPQVGGLSRVSRRGRVESFYPEQTFTRQGLMLQPWEPVKLGIKLALCDFLRFSSTAKSPSFFPLNKSEKKNYLSDCLRNGALGNWDEELERLLYAPPIVQVAFTPEAVQEYASPKVAWF